MELNELQQQRLAKLERLRAAGIDAYPPRTQRTHPIRAVLAGFDQLMERGERVTVAGRIIGARRVLGKLAFAHIADESGRSNSGSVAATSATSGSIGFATISIHLTLSKPVEHCAARSAANLRCSSSR